MDKKGKMKGRSRRILGLALVSLLWVCPAQADLLVDTGYPSGSPTWRLYQNEWLAGEFNTGAHISVTRVEGYIWQLTGGQGVVKVVIYTDGGEVPGTVVGSQNFEINAPGNTIAWFGVDLASPLAVAPHTEYWVAFEVRVNSPFNGAMLGSAPNHLGNEAIYSDGFGYNPRDEIDIGVRIYGASVPLPGPVWLLGSGLLGLVGWRRFRKG